MLGGVSGGLGWEVTIDGDHDPHRTVRGPHGEG
jgi:hypothetical protein